MSETAARSFGSLLRRLRVAAELSQEELAERANVRVRAIGDLEKGRRAAPRLATLRLLGDALRLTDADRASFFASARAELAGGKPFTPPAPPPGSLGMPARRHGFRLPIPPSRPVGREAEVADVCAALRRSNVRLLTLTGPGGVGKTRLALAVAAEHAAEFPEGAVFVELGSVVDRGLPSRRSPAPSVSAST